MGGRRGADLGCVFGVGQPAARLEQARAEAAAKLEPNDYREQTESVLASVSGGLRMRGEDG